MYAFSNYPIGPNFLSSSTPARDFVNPGIGLNVSMYDLYVPTFSKNFLEVKKQIEPLNSDVSQTGSGSAVKDEGEEDKDLNMELKQKMDPQIFASFQKPNFVKSEKLILQKKRKPTMSVLNKEIKKAKIIEGGSNKNIHKFKFY